MAVYTLVMAAVMLPGRLLGDRFGRKRFIVLGVVVFGVASLACAFAPSPALFKEARQTVDEAERSDLWKQAQRRISKIVPAARSTSRRGSPRLGRA